MTMMLAMHLDPVGVARSPDRPNPVLISAVPLLQRDENVLIVKRLEAADGSPIIDVKPYSKNFLQVDGLKVPDWMEQIHRELEDEKNRPKR